jgi:peptidoglycan/xylan/chitin deacetylase (PgdA/CDA1 family)
MHRRAGWLPAAALALAAVGPAAGAGESGVVLLYHHVDDTTPASTSIRRDEFAAQLEYLERENYAVMPLLGLIEALEAGREVPERSVAITFDDAYRTVLTGAVPALEARGWPFTVFVNTRGIDDGYAAYMSWDELRQIGDRGATIGNHSLSHPHLVRREPDETEDAWRRRVAAEIQGAQVRLEHEVGDYLLPIFAYPYGEYTPQIKSLVSDAGLYGLGQQSGAIGPRSDFLALPRYPIATGLGLTADEFALRVRSRPLPVSVLDEERHIVADGEERPVLRLALGAADDVRRDALACFASGQGRMRLTWIGDGQDAFSVEPERPIGPGRIKYNCTAPSRSTSGVYYWYSYLWMNRRADGSWYDE